MWVCRLPVHIGPAGCTGFTEILGEFVTSHWGGQSRPPAGYIGSTEIFGETAASQRADVGIGPYRTPANPYYPANFEHKAFLPQILKRNYLQI